MTETICYKLSWHLKYLSLGIIYRIRGIFKPNFSLDEGIKIPVNIFWSVFLQRFIYNKEIEKTELKILKATVSQLDKIMELGTGLGITSTFCSLKVGSQNVYTFDGNPFLFKHLNKMYKINRVNPIFESVILNHNQSNDIVFYVNKRNLISSSLYPVAHTHKVIAKQRSLNKEIERINPSYLIVDIEGGEYELFKEIQLNNIQKIQLELHPTVIGEEKVKEVIENIKKQGFEHRLDVSDDPHQAFFQKQ